MKRVDVLVVAVLMVVALVLRWIVAGQTLYADELSTWWLMTRHSLPDGLAIAADRMEITPPLSFVLAWIATIPGDGARLLRAPALVSTVLLVPAVYALARQTVGRRAGLVAAALAAVSPFAVFYGAEARAYAPLMLLVVLTTLAALRAQDTRRARWWAAYGVGVAACALTHYTSLYVLLALYGWLVVTDRRARVPATLACAGAVVLFLPWALTGLGNDLDSPDSVIASALTVFTPTAVARETAHWLIGFPLTAVGLGEVPGWPAVALLAAGGVLGAAGTAAGVASGRLPRRPSARTVLIVVLGLATIAGTLASSFAGNHQLYVRNLSASFGPFCVLAAAVLLAAGPRLRVVAVAAVVTAMAWGGVQIVLPEHGRPRFGPAADLIDEEVRPGDVIVDGTGGGLATPGPMTPLDSAIDPDLPTIRLGVPQARDRQFREAGPPVTAEQAVAAAIRDAGRDGRIVVVSPAAPDGFLDGFEGGLRAAGLDAPWRVVRRLRSPAAVGGVETLVFARR